LIENEILKFNFLKIIDLTEDFAHPSESAQSSGL